MTVLPVPTDDELYVPLAVRVTVSPSITPTSVGVPANDADVVRSYTLLAKTTFDAVKALAVIDPEELLHALGAV